MTQEVLIYSSSRELNNSAAGFIVDASKKAIAARGRFTIALAGGSTPKTTYQTLAQAPFARSIDWERTFVFMSDERCVLFDDERSNYGMAREALLSHIPIPDANLLPIPTGQGSPDQVAEQYAKILSDFFGTALTDAPPAFDLILLGLGDDGHTASLFPGYPTLQETERWVTASPPGTLPPPVDRVTFTFPLINAARAVLMLVAGENKAAPVRDVLGGGAAVQERPAAGVQPTGKLVWMLDTKAAGSVKAARL